MAKSFSRSWSVTGSKKTVNSPGGTTVTPTSQSFTTATTVSGGLNPAYKQQIAAGVNATTQLIVDAQEVQVTRGFAAATVSTAPNLKTSWTANGLMPFDSPNLVTPAFNSNAEAIAIRSLYRQIRELHNQFQGGVFVGELGQTVKMIMNPLGAFTKASVGYLQTARKASASARRGGSSKRASKVIADLYLQWVYGVRPLMGDIADISKTIDRIISDPPRTRFTATGVHDSQGRNLVLGPITIMGNILATRNDVIKTRSMVKYYGAFKAMTNEQETRTRIARVLELSGFTARDFIPTIWNLLPWSFIADYFVNIGDVLEAITTDTSQVAWISRTQVVERSHIYNVVPDLALSKASGQPTWSWLSFSGSGGGFVAKRTTINRAQATVPIMTLRSKIQVSTRNKVLNMLALIVSKR